MRVKAILPEHTQDSDGEPERRESAAGFGIASGPRTWLESETKSHDDHGYR